MALEPPGQFALPFLSNALLKTMQTGPMETPRQLPSHILIEKQCEMVLEPSRQFALTFLIKSLLKAMRTGPWSLQGTFLYSSVLDPCEKRCKLALEPLRQFPSPVLIKFLFKWLDNGSGASSAVPFLNSFKMMGKWRWGLLGSFLYLS